ncbi:MAG: response regulator transcription factor [Actinomycetia bacterium]|nr:response regulator transcription factor [Actinomycetes bacterium]
MIRVLVVDDHPVVRAGIEALLSARRELHVVGAAASGAEALTLARDLAPDVVLCDLRLGEGIDGVEVTRALLADPGIPVLILTTYDHDRDILRAVEAGAAGYLLKDAEPDAIVAAIERAAAGESGLDAVLTERVVATMRTRRAGLSERELDVLRLVGEGRTNRDIAKELFLSEATVKTHLVHAYGKLGVDNRISAVTAARDAGLID